MPLPLAKPCRALCRWLYDARHPLACTAGFAFVAVYPPMSDQYPFGKTAGYLLLMLVTWAMTTGAWIRFIAEQDDRRRQKVKTLWP